MLNSFLTSRYSMADMLQTSSSRPFQETLQFGDLQLCASFCASYTILYSSIEQQQAALAHGFPAGRNSVIRSASEGDKRTEPFFRMYPSDESAGRCLQKHNERWLTVRVKSSQNLCQKNHCSQVLSPLTVKTLFTKVS